MSKLKAVYIISWHTIGDDTASELASRLQTHPVSALYLEGGKISNAGTEVLVRTAFRNMSLSAFCIESSEISDVGAKTVAEAVRNCRSLTTFYLGGWEISDSGAKTVAEAVKGCPLSAFYLRGDKISDAGAIVVAEMVKDYTLSAFSIRSTMISDAGAIAVAEAVKDCPLSVLSLWSTLISDAGAIAVAKAVKDCTLSAFRIYGDAITDAGVTTVMEILSSGCTNTLSALCLGNSCISDLGIKKVVDAVISYPRLSAFYLDSKPISGETLAYILERMAGINTILSVNLVVGDISKEQMGSCLDRLQQSGIGKQLKLRFECGSDHAKIVCTEFAAEWNGKFPEFRIIPYVNYLFFKEMMIGVLR